MGFVCCRWGASPLTENGCQVWVRVRVDLSVEAARAAEVLELEEIKIAQVRIRRTFWSQGTDIAGSAHEDPGLFRKIIII